MYCIKSKIMIKLLYLSIKELKNEKEKIERRNVTGH